MLVYFEGPYGVLVLERSRIIGARENRLPTELPSCLLLDCNPYEMHVRNKFDDVQRRLIAADSAAAA